MSAHDPKRRLQSLGLTIRVHGEAMVAHPRRYARSVLFRLRGLRVRARNHRAALLGQTRSAYRLWISRHEVGSACGEISATILPVIDCRQGLERLDATLQSYERAGGDLALAHFIGKPPFGGNQVRFPKDLARVGIDPAAWLLPLKSGDRLAPHALRAYAEVAADGQDIIYADDDLLDKSGARADPHFKSDWNPDLFKNHDFLSGASIFRAPVEWLEQVPDEGWDTSLIARLLARGTVPRHVHEILHHRSERQQPRLPLPAQPPVLSDYPLVTIIIPTRNKAHLLRLSVAAAMRCDYPRTEILIVDNGSDEIATIALLKELQQEGVRVLTDRSPFNFSRLNNLAVQQAQGSFCCFLNNDVEMLDNSWLRWLVRQAMRPDVGAVGARLLYPDGTIQHAGVVIGLGGAAGHAHRGQPAKDLGYFARTHLPQRVSAVTAACMLVEKSKFQAVDGFDEDAFPVAFNDVDLCMRFNARGWQTFYEPRATLIHHESQSRGKDLTPAKRSRFAAELAALQKRWSTASARDPYHHPSLSRDTERFVIDVMQ